MSIYPKTAYPEKLVDLFKKITEAETPKKFTYRFLMRLGFSSSKERDLLPILKHLGLLDKRGKPSSYYGNLKNTREFSKALEERIKETYSEVFKMDDRLPEVEKEIISGYFGQLTGQSQRECLQYTETFLSLCRLAKIDQPAAKFGRKDNQLTKEAQSAKQPNITFNINLPITTDEKVYEAIFKNLKDYLTH